MPAPTAGRYVTIADTNTFLGKSGEDTLIYQLIVNAEALFDNIISSKTGLISSTKTEDFPIFDKDLRAENTGRVFWLRTHYPTSITTVNAVSPGTLDVDYTLERTRLEFKNAVAVPNAFPYRYRIAYVSGYTAIDAGTQTYPLPSDVKLAIYMLVGALYNSRNADGISEFKQDLLTVKYSDKSILKSIMDPASFDSFQSIAQSYTVPRFL